MATLENDELGFEPDWKIIEAQCDAVQQRDPAVAAELAKMRQSLREIRDLVAAGSVGRRFFELLRTAFRTAFDHSIDEPFACLIYYSGAIGLHTDDKASAIKDLNISIQATQDPWLALSSYNLAMVYFMNIESHEQLLRAATATKNVVAGLPASRKAKYFESAACYNIAESYYRQGKNREAIPDARAALIGFHHLGMEAEAKKSEGMLGCVLSAAGERHAGIKHASDAIEYFAARGNDGELATLLMSRGRALADEGRPKEAIADLRGAIKRLRLRNEPGVLKRALLLLSELESK